MVTSTNGKTRTRSSTKKALGDVIARESTRDDLDPKAKQVAAARRNKIKSDTAEVSAEKAAAKIASVNVEISKAFANIQNETNVAIAELNTIREAISVAEEELEDLHGKDVVSSSVAELIDSFERKKADLEAEFASKKASLDESIESQRIAWDREQAETDRVRRQTDDEYNYNLGLKRRREDDIRKEALRREEIENKLKQEALERSWNARETELQNREVEFKSIKTEIESFPDKLKSEVEAKVKIATNSLKRELEHATQLRELEFTNQISTLQGQVDSLNARNTEKSEQIQDLQLKLAQAQAQTQQLAVKALEVQSGKDALDQVQKMAEKTGMKK